jgi:hypothetical protein
MKGWLDECGHRHAECHINTMAPAPTRLLDIGSETENREPRLILAGQRELTYAILSYCREHYRFPTALGLQAVTQ